MNMAEEIFKLLTGEHAIACHAFEEVVDAPGVDHIALHFRVFKAEGKIRSVVEHSKRKSTLVLLHNHACKRVTCSNRIHAGFTLI